MPKRPTSRRRSSLLTADINLIPIMNLFMVLVPFLLLTAVFAKTAVIDIYLPQIQETSSAGKGQYSVLVIHVVENGFTFGGIGSGLNPIWKKDGRFNFALLTEKLLELKKDYPDKAEVILLFEPAAPYELVIKMMDSTRDVLVKEDGKTTRKTLFPLVSVGENV